MAKTIEGQTVLHMANREGVLRKILHRYAEREFLLATDRQGNTALHRTVERGTARAVDLLLKTTYGREMSEVLNLSQTSALGVAVMAGDSRSVAAFLQAGYSLENVTVLGHQAPATVILEELIAKSSAPSLVQLYSLIQSGRLQGAGERYQEALR